MLKYDICFSLTTTVEMWDHIFLKWVLNKGTLHNISTRYWFLSLPMQVSSFNRRPTHSYKNCRIPMLGTSTRGGLKTSCCYCDPGTLHLDYFEAIQVLVKVSIPILNRLDPIKPKSYSTTSLIPHRRISPKNLKA